jgi:hypothetical protein
LNIIISIYNNINKLSINIFLLFLEELTTYSIKVFAVNNVGIGNSSFLVSAQTELLPEPTPSPNPRTNNDSLNAGVVTGGVIGAILFLILALIVLYRVRRKIRIKEHEKSVRVKLSFLKTLPDIFCYI